MIDTTDTRDRSQTHVMVRKNGIKDWMPKTVWKSIGGESNTEGWVLVEETPPSVIEIRQKKAETKEEIVSENIEGDSVQESAPTALKEKVKSVKKK